MINEAGEDALLPFMSRRAFLLATRSRNSGRGRHTAMAHAPGAVESAVLRQQRIARMSALSALLAVAVQLLLVVLVVRAFRIEESLGFQ